MTRIREEEEEVKILSNFDKIWCITADIEPDEILKSTITVS